MSCTSIDTSATQIGTKKNADNTPFIKRSFNNDLDIKDSRDIRIAPASFHDDLMGNVPIYNIWFKKFSENGVSAEEGWHTFRKHAITCYEHLDRTLKQFEDKLTIQVMELNMFCTNSYVIIDTSSHTYFPSTLICV